MTVVGYAMITSPVRDTLPSIVAYRLVVVVVWCVYVQVHDYTSQVYGRWHTLHYETSDRAYGFVVCQSIRGTSGVSPEDMKFNITNIMLRRW